MGYISEKVSRILDQVFDFINPTSEAPPVVITLTTPQFEMVCKEYENAVAGLCFTMFGLAVVFSSASFVTGYVIGYAVGINSKDKQRSGR